MPKTVILGTARTPFGKLGGGLSSLDATDLGGHAIAAALERAEVAPDQVAARRRSGQVLQAGQGQIPSRQAQIKGGIPKEVSSETVNKVCASGIRAAGMIDQAVRAGDLEVGVAGGMESMSNAPYLLKEARFGYRMGDAKVLDAMIHDGLTNPFTGKHMAHEATEVADELEMTRADLDKFALRSHELAIQATDEGRLPEEIVAGHDQVEEGRDRRRGRRGAAPRHLARGAGQAASRSSSRTAPTPPATRPASTTAPARWCSPRDEWAKAERPRGAGHDRRPGRGGRRLPLPRPHARQRHQGGAREGRPDASTTSTCSRSTRRSPRSRSTRCGCSASTRARST